MIDPVHTLAFSIQSNRGIYAVLLGSGVSRSARIPTGWEITLELIRKLAVLENEPCSPSPEEWFQQRYGEEPNYSNLLDSVAKTPAERRQLLSAYFEPTPEERVEGAKQPTVAHRAIASMVAGGFIRVILTTNFDRLMELALEESGITPTVISNVDQLKGAIPLIHTQCCVVKLHGDYLDTRILNTPQELATYPNELNGLLDRVLDEFGLIVCGWSAEWDEALRNSLKRSPSRRFSTYWAARGELTDEAKRLITHRGAQTIHINCADSFFMGINNLVRSLEEFSRPHPLSTFAAVTSLKRYLTDSRFRIQLSDLVKEETDRVLGGLDKSPFTDVSTPPTPESFLSRVRAYEGVCETLTALAVIGGYWSEEQHYPVWVSTLTRLASSPIVGGNTILVDFRPYPATLFLYSLGVAAVESDQLKLIGKLFTAPVRDSNRQEHPVVQLLHPLVLISNDDHAKALLGGTQRHHYQLSHWLYSVIREVARETIPNDRSFELAFDELEILMSLSFATYADWGSDWIPLGEFGPRRQNRELILRKIEESLSTLGGSSPYVVSKIFGETKEACNIAISKLNANVAELQRYFRF